MIQVSEEVAEAFGGVEFARMMVQNLLEIFVQVPTEACAIVGACDAHRFTTKVFASDGDPHHLTLPVAEILRTVVLDCHMEKGFVLAHSHPRQIARPSKADDSATMMLAWIGDVADRKLIDHWIFGSNGTFFSYSWVKPGHLKPSVSLEAEKE